MPPPGLPHTTQPIPHSIIPSASLTADPSRPQRPPDDELENVYDDDPPTHYPKPGHGLASTLPPEANDLHFLVDDNQEVYSHIYQTDPKVANEGVFANEFADKEETTRNEDDTGGKVDTVKLNDDNNDKNMDVDGDAKLDDAQDNDEKQSGESDVAEITAGAESAIQEVHNEEVVTDVA